MPVAAASLANLKSFQPGNKAPRRSADVERALRDLRAYSKRAVTFLGRLIEDEDAPTPDRLRAAIAIIDKVIPDAGADALAALNPDRVGSISLHIVRHEHMRQDDEAPKLSVRTITIGEADD